MNLIKIITLFLSMSSLQLSGQRNIAGLWEGVIHVGVDLQMVFHINQSGLTYTALLDVPGQGAKDIVVAVTQQKDSIIMLIAQIGGSYKGYIQSDSSITGSWYQGRAFPLNLHKVKEITVPKRPQTPKPPFHYQNADVVYYNSDSSIHYGATISTPTGKGPFPAVLLITGSGQQNRDEEMLQHRPFAVIADHLARNGYIVMRVDDRGMGETNGDVMNATSRDFANDAEISLDFLRKLQSVDHRKIGLLGHSEGGMIAQIIAAERKDIDFVIFLAGPGEKTLTLMEDQNRAILLKAGLSATYIDHYLELYRSLIPAIISASTLADAKKAATNMVANWTAKTDKNIVTATTHITNDSTLHAFADGFTTVVYNPWFKYFFSYDPDVTLRKLRSKVLALNGDQDIQVIAKTNLKAMETSLKKGSSKDITIRELNGLSHLFQHCHLCTVYEYGQLEETMAPEVLSIITSWLNTHVKISK